MLLLISKEWLYKTPLLNTKKWRGFKIKQSLLHTCTSREKASTMMFSFFWFSLTSRISPNIKTQLHWNHGKHFLCMYVNIVNMQCIIHTTTFSQAFPAGTEIFFSSSDGKAREATIAIHSGASFITIVTKITLLSHLNWISISM